MMLRLMVQTVVFVVGLGAVLFIAAGTAQWRGAWVFLGEMCAGGLVVGLWLAKHDPGLLAERLSPLVQPRQATWDKVLMAGVLLLWTSWLVFMALDAVRYRWSSVPVWAQAVGALGPAASFYVAFLTFRENPYAAPVVKVQHERNQTVVTTGPYRYVRHPMYAGAILFFLGTPLLLGSWYGLALTPLLLAVLAVRAVMEERTLEGQLNGYREYAARVRYRLIPWVW